MELKEKYDAICNEYYNAFCVKHGYEIKENQWIGEIGCLAYAENYIVRFSDIKYDIDNNINKEMYEQWQKYSDELTQMGLPKYISYEAFYRNEKLPYTKDQLSKLQDAYKVFTDAKLEFEELKRNIINEN